MRQAAFIGVGSMVGAGIFALLGAAGAVAGITLVGIVVLSIALDYWWKRSRASRAGRVQVGTSLKEQR